jgi:hypothetical protein
MESLRRWLKGVLKKIDEVLGGRLPEPAPVPVRVKN